ncbi:hypothetical protein HPB50_024273 [Hyalomma asiaticum]|uniref:Uncharacterized protein n=1 Tax=Hyalomma asiaticum TaxID=266040 RepID=A0ACB7RYR1_HYAAI|nr:hypothetical protein HPB50_024273 [Hyalomma asiaticum]
MGTLLYELDSNASTLAKAVNAKCKAIFMTSREAVCGRRITIDDATQRLPAPHLIYGDYPVASDWKRVLFTEFKDSAADRLFFMACCSYGAVTNASAATAVTRAYRFGDAVAGPLSSFWKASLVRLVGDTMRLRPWGPPSGPRLLLDDIASERLYATEGPRPQGSALHPTTNINSSAWFLLPCLCGPPRYCACFVRDHTPSLSLLVTAPI